MTNVDIPSPMKKRSPQGPPPNKSKWFMTNHSEECFFFCIHKNIGTGYFKWEFLHLSWPNIKSWQIVRQFYNLRQVTKSRPPLPYTNHCSENILAASITLSQSHRGIACLINMTVLLLSTCFWQLRQFFVMFWFNWWNN